MKLEKTDVAAILGKGLAGAIPIVGPLAAEVIGAVIPNQRMERIESLLESLEAKVKEAEIHNIEEKFSQPEFVDLLEDGFIQASKALSVERREYISSLLKNSLTEEQVKYQEYKKLLVLLNDLNDIEILLLKSYTLYQGDDEYDEFWGVHEDILTPPMVYIGSSDEDLDKEAIFATYKTRLVTLGLLRVTYRKPKKGDMPEFDEKTGMVKASGNSITHLGRLLLRSIDLATAD